MEFRMVGWWCMVLGGGGHVRKWDALIVLHVELLDVMEFSSYEFGHICVDALMLWYTNSATNVDRRI